MLDPTTPMWSNWNDALFREGGASSRLVMGNIFFWAEDLNYGVGTHSYPMVPKQAS